MSTELFSELSAVVKLSDVVDLVDDQGRPLNPPLRTRSIRSLKASIVQHGLLTPLTVGPKGDDGKYPLISGYRRRAALRALGWKEAPVQIVAVVAGLGIPLLLAAANIQNPLSPLQQAHQAQQLAQMKHTMRQIRIAIGLSVRDLRRRFALLKADPKVQRLVDTGKMSWSAFDHLRSKDVSSQVDIVERAQEKSRGTAKADGRVTINAVRSAKKEIKDEINGQPLAGDEVSLTKRLHIIERDITKVVEMSPFSVPEKLTLTYHITAIDALLDVLKEKIK